MPARASRVQALAQESPGPERAPQERATELGPPGPEQARQQVRPGPERASLVRAQARAQGLVLPGLEQRQVPQARGPEQQGLEQVSPGQVQARAPGQVASWPFRGPRPA